jgi:hypothetical protein
MVLLLALNWVMRQGGSITQLDLRVKSKAVAIE